MPAPQTPQITGHPAAAEPRTARTREALEAGLWELLRDHELSEISVAALCRRAGVHRTTFYGHHHSIFEFAASLYADAVDKLGAVNVDLNGAGLTREEVSVLYVDAVRQILLHIRSERRVYRALFSTGSFPGVLADGLKCRFRLALNVWDAHGLVPGLDLDVVAAFLGGAYASWFEEWAAEEDGDVEARLASLTHLLPQWWPREGFSRA
ncbi:TetR/AcrR family transcriptional regulator [Arthrobacter sp. ATA002]|uniref:TetR/AcrR family transcriptional regulator n=1 Tax=Arthrobacter sp. ATA002 TaxID=2991715 RepID=UPI0022A74388|nr:TetR/AcrR family transcriptional regulator [Arthrobacter sp. ATA002]WAP52065.1 TetR/AcrR family transcriptional regulator [Arthrobacter sp. ATA002]